MIEEIQNIHYQSFNNYNASSIKFKNINLIYGLNGVGKSSLRKFLIENKDNIPKITHCSQSDYEVFSYDEDYKRNVLYIHDDEQNNFGSFYVGNEIRPIVEEKRRIAQKIEKAKVKQEAVKKNLNDESEKLGEFKQEIAGETREVLRKINPDKFKSPQSYTRTHINNEGFTNFKVLNNDELMQKQQYSMNNIPDAIVLFQFIKTNTLAKSVNTLRDILKLTPENKAIERFKKDSQLEGFARAALEIKRKSRDRDYDEKCPLCEQSIVSIKLWENLEEHFNAEYDNLIERLYRAKDYFQDIDSELKSFQAWLNKNLVQTRILSKKKVDIDALRQQYFDAASLVGDDIKKIFKALEEKLKTPNGDISLGINDENFKENAEQILSDEIKKIVDSHNEQQKRYSEIIKENIEEIKQHYIAKKRDEYLEIQNKIKRYERKNERFSRYVECCELQIDELDKELKKLDKGFEQINNDLRDWFCFDGVRFEKVSDSQYVVQRQNCNGEWFQCKNSLSEGEKTIVSLAYFVNYYFSRLQTEKYPIVIFDDPITSLDARHRDSIKNYILNKIKESSENNHGQFFIFSHEQRLIDKLRKEFSNKAECIEITKNKLESHIGKLNESNNNEFKKLFNQVEKCAEGEGESGDSRCLRDFLESLFDIVFLLEDEQKTNFTFKYNKLLEYLNVGTKYTSSDIQDLNHHSDEDLTPELPEKAKFVISVFDALIRKIKDK